MIIGLVDVDNWKKLNDCFPNLALMKISAYHKKKGDHVEWYQPLFGTQYDIVYMSKVFSFSEEYPYFINSKKIYRGGGQGIVFLLLTEKKFLTSRNTKNSPMK